jgi:molybdenum cofactor biosynthesis enzyme MoaA
VTLSNHCNRSCPWCSTCSSPEGKAHLAVEDFTRHLPEAGEFEVQLEGGEPTIHPEFWRFVRASRAHPRCRLLVLCTNGVALPRQPKRLRPWLEALGMPLTLKLSVNHHLLERDPGLLELARQISAAFAALGGPRQLVLNVRLRKGAEDDDAWVVDRVTQAGLAPLANVFYLQRYGFAEGMADWGLPFLVGTNFSLINPDGQVFGPDLLARSAAMRKLP